MKKLLFVLALLTQAVSAPILAADIQAWPAANKANDDYAVGKKAVDAQNWQAAVDAFGKAAQHDPKNPDIQNMLGYSYRKLNNLDLSFKYYNEALRLDPDHRGANEYIGIAYLKADNVPKAEEHLARLEKICGKNCEEYRALSDAIVAYNKKEPVSW